MHPVLRKLSLFAHFSAEERAAFELVLTNTFEKPPRSQVVSEDDPPSSVLFLLEGFVCRSKMLPDGRRQILSFVLPGDSCDVGVSMLERRDHSLMAMSACRLARVSDLTLEHLMTQYPKVRAALQWATLQAEAISREWIINVGQRSAEEWMAHLFCELYQLMKALGLSEGANFAVPLTQGDLGEALGLSVVHVNRTLQRLRGLKLVAYGDKRLTMLDVGRLEDLASFDPTYLHLGARFDEAQRLELVQ